MSKKFPLSKGKKKWVKQTHPTATLRGSALNFPVGVEKEFVRDFKKIVKAVIRETEKTVKQIFATPASKEFFAEETEPITLGLDDDDVSAAAKKALEGLFNRVDDMTKKRAKAVSERMVDGVNRSSQASMASSLKELSGGVTLKTSALGGDISIKLQAAIKVNTDLIHSVTGTYINNISDAVYRSIMLGNGLQDLIPFLRDQSGMTHRHAKNVALDQTRKAYTSLNLERMKNVGLTHFEWLHSGGGQRPRKFHIDQFPAGLNGGIYRVDDPPVIDKKTGEKGFPAQAIFCKCRMIPVLVLEDGEPT